MQSFVSRYWRLGLILAAIGLIFVIAQAQEAAHQEQKRADLAARLDAVMDTVTVVYDVLGDAAAANITYQAPTGTRQQEGIDVPIVVGGQRHGITYKSGFAHGDFLYLSVQRRDDLGGGDEVTCRITVDGIVVSENTSYGGYSVASCSARS